ncbi:hypothetical protein BDZ85DRAFT_3501 [Elsinoe ampelina]|uniref:Uncharacterized protein n=1 Tax=Elsinoe ampelina TaxID=302913 RepID=A0A6A6GNW9_9PEZI|nr:hypothetical protein BDZ85DRAFT_3501 [Elsinoe ampelina]
MTVQHPTMEVRFAAADVSIPTGMRILNPQEKASVTHFEGHAATCRHCQDAYHRFKAGKIMCAHGAALISDVNNHIVRYHSEIFSRRDPTVRISMPTEFKHIDDALKLIEKKGPRAPFGLDDKKIKKEAEGRSHHSSSKKDKHKRVDSHGSASYTQDQYAAAQAFYPSSPFSVRNMSPSSSRTSSTESRRPRSFELDQAYGQRSESVAATIGTRAPAYDTKDFKPSLSRHKSHRR